MAENFTVIEAAAGEEKKNAKCSGVAYTGKPINVGWGAPVVLELSGLDIPEKVPLLADHRNAVTHKIGEVSAHLEGGELRYSGEIFAESDLAEGVMTQARNGGSWQNSVGVSVQEYRWIEENETVLANGTEQSGPLWYVAKSKLNEISVVAIGADDQTSMAIAASLNMGEPKMPEKKINAAGGETAGTHNEHPAAAPDVKGMAEQAVRSMLEDARSAEAKRVSDIRALFGNDYPEVLASCVSEGTSLEAAKDRYIEAMRKSRPTLNLMMPNGTDRSEAVVEAAALLALGRDESKLEKHGYKPETIDAARKHFRGGASLQQILLIQARANGCMAPTFRGYEREVLQAAFSTNAIGGILSNVANKTLLDAFLYVEQSWRKIAAITSAVDFKRYTNYRLTGDLSFRKVAKGGEIASGSLGEDAFGNQVSPYGRMLILTWEDLRNDDLGALDKAAALLGRGAALGLNRAFWTEFLDNSTFFSSGNKNLVSSNAFGVAGVTKALEAFRKQTDANGEPLGIAPRYVVVPPALEVEAEQLYKDTNVENADAKKPATTGNPHRGKFEPVPSAYLDNAAISGGSASTWYLVADPMALPVMEVAFLDGQQVPAVETASADFETLGIKMRGYFAFGVEKQDPRGAVKSTEA